MTSQFVVCCGMQRSGSSLQYNVVKEIVQTTPNNVMLGWTIWQDFAKEYNKYKNHDGIVVMKTHPALHIFYPKMHDLFFGDSNLKFIYSYRHILDVVASLLRFGSDKEVTFSSSLAWIIQTHNAWLQIPRSKMFVGRYEEFYNNIGKLVEDIATFLNIPLTEQQIDTITKSNVLSSTKKKIEKNRGESKFDKQTTYWKQHITNEGLIYSYEQTLSADEISMLLAREDVRHFLDEMGYDAT